MPWKATAKSWHDEGEIVEEFEAKNILRLVESMQERFQAYGDGIWVVIPHRDNPLRNFWWYASVFRTPSHRLKIKVTVKTLPDRLVVRIRHL